MLTGRSETLEGHFVFLNTDLIKIVSELIFLFVNREPSPPPPLSPASPVGNLSRTVSELPPHQPLVAAQRELGTHQEAAVKEGKA